MDELACLMGQRQVYATLLELALSGLGRGVDNELPSLRLEREATIASLRGLCEEFGDNDWSDDLHLADVIDKHLAPYLTKDATDE